MEFLQDYLPQVISTAFVLLFVPVSKAIVNKIVWSYGTRVGKVPERIMHTSRVICIMVNLCLFFSVVVIWGVDPRHILAAVSSGLAFIGVALFAQWSFLSNVTAGLIIFFTTPFKIGDDIVIVDKDLPLEGKIEAIMSFYTHLRTKDGDLVVISNSLFMQKIVSMKKDNQE